MTLVETVLSFTLVSLGLLAAVALLNSSFLLSASSRHNNQGEQLLQQMMEFYSQDYPHYGDTTYQIAPVLGADQVSYQRKFSLSTFSTTLGAPIRRLEATVSWQWKGRLKEKKRVKLVCRPGR